MVKAWASREIFFQGDKVGEPITSLETQLTGVCIVRVSLLHFLSLSLYIYVKSQLSRSIYRYIYRLPERNAKKKTFNFCVLFTNRNILAKRKCQNRTALKLKNANFIPSR